MLEMVQYEAMPLAVMPQAWDHPDWLWEIKYDGFRSLACVERGACRLVSRKHARYKAFPGLEAAILANFDHDVVLDGEIVCLDARGLPQFYDLLWHRGDPWFYTFDVALQEWQGPQIAAVQVQPPAKNCFHATRERPCTWTTSRAAWTCSA
jgi:ATP dependent DNA ligase domain